MVFWSSEHAEITSIYSIHLLCIVTKMKWVYWAIRTGLLNAISLVFIFTRLETQTSSKINHLTSDTILRERDWSATIYCTLAHYDQFCTQGEVTAEHSTF